MCGYPTNDILRKVNHRHHRLPKSPLASFRPGPLLWTPTRSSTYPLRPRRSSGAPWMMGASRCQGPLEDFWVVSANVELMLIVGFGWWFGIFPIPFSWHVKKNTRKNTWLACKKQTMTNHAMKHVWAGFKMVDFTAIVMLVIWGGKRTSRYMEKKDETCIKLRFRWMCEFGGSKVFCCTSE